MAIYCVHLFLTMIVASALLLFMYTTITQCFVLIPNFQAIGLIAIDPETLCSVPFDGVIKDWNKSPDIWILTEDTVYHNGEKEKRITLGIFKPDSNTIGCRVNEKGYLEFIMDEKNHGVVWSKPLPMDRPLWGFVDLPIEYKILACFTHGNMLCVDGERGVWSVIIYI